MIVLLTDFGLKDEYVAEMKAAIKYIEPSVEIIDLTHFVESGNIKHGQFFLKYSYKFFPKNTIFVAVVDPGVGGERAEVCVRFEERWFITPDNGILSFAQNGIVYRIKNVKNPITKSISNTFHGRDIFAPAAAYLYQGRGDFFERIENLSTLLELEEVKSLNQLDRGEILHIDNFGNIITNISDKLFEKIKIEVNGKTISHFANSFEEAKLKGYDLFISNGSKGLLEIASPQNNAAKILNAKISQKIKISEV
ncbi:adenosyl-fluoride synthase [Thermotomaculum hydrothermale]|uniref:Adenosyl-fluoride synthase n=1 Tax=Thermotomaculum hydrothermale TaxID=981385 RepID=A0A7R6PF77_9BACT|nr:SAM-dependent chlorinase/fluorinase [Thermotomaculum hydrothermale]BBB32628.1 adenosyl-fluoride synthase [Thermotomaculum hydrothermale]